MKAVTKDLLPVIPTDLAVLVGEIVIRFGELERCLITALARITYHKEEEFIAEVGRHKRGDFLGRLIDRAERELDGKYDWFDCKVLLDLKEKRNFIHDALMQEQDGAYVWQSNSPKREHRKVDYSDLIALREEVVQVIIRINDGSLRSKKGRLE
jgi:hypothetical protein